MVLILNGSSEYDAHVRSEHGYLNRYGIFLRSTAIVEFVEERILFAHTHNVF